MHGCVHTYYIHAYVHIVRVGTYCHFMGKFSMIYSLLLEIWSQDKVMTLGDSWKCKDFVYKVVSFHMHSNNWELFLFCFCYILALIKDPKIDELSQELQMANEKVQ